MQLRPYQQQALDSIRAEFRAGRKKVLLHLSTGGGKTVIFSRMLIDSAARGNKAIMVVRGKALVEQASQRLFREHVPHGVLQASHWNQNAQAPIQICSIDTLMARGLRPEAKLIVIDEAHMAVTGGFKEFIESYPDAFIVSVTATPYTKESLEHLAEAVVNPISMSDLISQGYLVLPRYFAPSKPNLNGVHTRQGDYVPAELEQRMGVLTGDIVSHWRGLGENRPTVCFAVNIHHSQAIVAEFNRAGIPAEHIEGNHSAEHRAEVLRRLENGETKVVSNVGVLCTGVDLPFLGCLVMARPTKSYNLFIQQAGRGTRPFQGKRDFILLDHADNVRRHGFITNEREVLLEGSKRERDPGDEPSTCKVCYSIFPTGSGCPLGCSPPVVEKKRELEIDSEGRLEELNVSPIVAEIALFVQQCKDTAKQRGYKSNWTWYKVSEKYGEAVADVACPKRVKPWFL